MPSQHPDRPRLCWSMIAVLALLPSTLAVLHRPATSVAAPAPSPHFETHQTAESLSGAIRRDVPLREAIALVYACRVDVIAALTRVALRRSAAAAAGTASEPDPAGPSVAAYAAGLASRLHPGERDVHDTARGLWCVGRTWVDDAAEVGWPPQ